MKNTNKLLAPGFILAVGVLLLNDLYLKYEFHNYLTGKLSDFAGLFAFPFFMACFFQKRVKAIYWITAILFLIWKSSLIQPLLDFANGIGLPVDRTVDMTDAMALVIMPLSYNYWTRSGNTIKWRPKISKNIVAGISIFAFVATTMPSRGGEYNWDSDLTFNVKYDLTKISEDLRLYDYPENDSYHYSIFDVNRHAWIGLKIRVSEKGTDSASIKLDSILGYTVRGDSGLFCSVRYNETDLNYFKYLTKAQIEELFKKDVYKKLKIEE